MKGKSVVINANSCIATQKNSQHQPNVTYKFLVTRSSLPFFSQGYGMQKAKITCC